MTQEILETVHANIRKNIECTDMGFALMCISPNEADSHDARFFYTIGLSEQSLPELFLSGNMRPEIVGRLFADTVEKWKKEGVRLGLDMNIAMAKESGEALKTKFVSLDTEHAALNRDYAMQLFEHYHSHYPNKLSGEIEMVQMVWPDRNNCLPTESGYDASMSQTLLPTKLIH